VREKYYCLDAANSCGLSGSQGGKAIQEAVFQSPLSTHCFIKRFIADLELTKPRQQEKVDRCRATRWIPPLHFAKINMDAAKSKNSSSASVAAVARDISGLFLGASTVVFTGVSDPETLEILACREGLALASDLLISKARVASDCVNAVNSLQGEGMGQYGPIT